jgi:hypothetical protein
MKIRYFTTIMGQFFGFSVLIGGNVPLNVPLKYLGTIPKNFCCPLTKDIMKDPVTTRNGTYERSALAEYLKKSNKGDSLSSRYQESELRPDFDLKNQIHHWVVNNHTPPEMAKNHKDEFRQFIKSRLIFNPNTYDSNSIVDIPFTTLSNPLSEKFNLSLCKAPKGNIPSYFNVSTGFREVTDIRRKMQIWIAPRFLAENVIMYRDLLDSWPKNCPIGLFYNSRNWPLDSFAYQTNIPLERLYRENFMELFQGAKLHKIRIAYDYHKLPNLNHFRLSELKEFNTTNTPQERPFRRNY